MACSLDYLDFRSDISFVVSPINDIDLFLFSQLSTPNFVPLFSGIKRVRLGDAVSWYLNSHNLVKSETIGTLQSDSIFPMLQRLTNTVRYKDTFLCYAANRLVTENTEQFAAITIDISDGPIIVSFRGTDDTIIGWKEDFNLAASSMVPAQKDALEYLQLIADKFPGRDIYVCGHSKGGNLSVFAGSQASLDVQSRIVSIINYDGPGFLSDFLDTDGYNRIKDRITTILSQNSMVGTLLNRVGTVKYVISTAKGAQAHDGFTWLVKGTDFIQGEGLSDTSRAFETAINDTLSDMDFSQRRAFINELFDTLLSSGASTITELTNINPKTYLDMIINLKNDKLVGKFIFSVIETMFKCYGRN